MSEEIIKLQLRKVKLLQAVEDTKQKKEKIILIVQSLVKELNSGKIRRSEYEEKLNCSLKNRTAEQWIKYYEDYINYYDYQIKLCDKLISETKKKEKVESKTLKKKEQKKEKITIYGGWEEKPRKSKLTPILIILIGVVLIAIIFSLFVDLKLIGIQSFNDIKSKISGVFEAAGEKPEISEVKLPEVRGRGGGREGLVAGGVQEKPIDGIYETQIKQSQAVVGEPVKWTQNITVDSDTGLNIKLPENSKNIKVKKIKNEIEEEVTDSADIGEELFGKKINIKFKDNSETGKQTYEVIYETPAPEIEVIQGGIKTNIKITGPDDVHYQDIFSFTKIPEILKIGEQDKLKLYQTKENGIESKKQIPITLYDTDENGLYDKVEWITLGLSDWEGYLIIEISKAEYLDTDKNFISDIYEQVKELDDVWSETINESEYVKVTFEKKLDNTRDITIYPRNVSGNPRIEVYESEGVEKIAEFDNLINNIYNKILLTNLTEGYTQDVFDLKIVDGSVEFDHIIDPDWTWWNPAWLNKKRINITEMSGVALTNYQVKLTIDYITEMQANFDDLRFTNYNDDILLDYWIEDKLDSNWAEVWVEVPSLAASKNTTIYMYYNNAGASAYSNIGNTFLKANKYLSPLWTSSFSGDFSCALISDGTVKCWGSNNYGQLGRTCGSVCATPGLVDGVSNAVAIGTGYWHACALISDGTVKCWGRNQYSQLGRSCGAQCTSGTVTGLSNVISISLGNINSCALISDGTVKCWGDNWNGQSGPCGGGDTCSSPTSVGLSNAVSIGLGSYHSCAVISDGTVKCWGDSYYGESGSSCNTGCPGYGYPEACCVNPSTVSGISNARSLGLGEFHSCALINTGNVNCWGSNIYGQAPTSLGITTARSITAGYQHSCVLINNENVNCLGRNNYYQLGRNCGTQCTSGAVGSLSNVASVSAGYYHSCALINDGTVKCWGDDSLGQFGDGTAGGTSYTPVLTTNYNLGGRFDKDDQFGTAYDMPDYSIDDFFVRKYASVEPVYSFVSTFTGDATPPLISIIYPLNNTNSSNNKLNVNYTRSDTNLASCWYSNDTMLVNISLGTGGVCTNITTITWTEGIHNVKIWANDTWGNVNSSSVRFRIDTISPQVQFVPLTETSGTTLTTNNLLVNVTATDSGSGLKNITIRLYNSTRDLINSTNSTASPLYINFSNLTNGIYFFNATAYDNVGNLNSTETRNVTINVVANSAPVIKKFIAVTETNDNVNGATGPGEIQGAAGGTAGTGFVSVRFKFIVEDLDNTPGTGDDLPGGPGSGTAINYGNNLNVVFTAPVHHALTHSISASAGDCIATSCNGDTECSDSSAETRQVKYICDLDMHYYNPSALGTANGDDLWTISVSITDNTGVNSDSKQSGNTGFNVLTGVNADYINYRTIQAVSLPGTTTLQWVTNKLDVNAENNPADAGINVENAGNVAITSENIIAQNLVDPTNNANKILASAFAVDNVVGTSLGTGACDDGGTADILTSGAAKAVSIAIPYTGAGIATDKITFYYCAYPIVNPSYLQGIQAQSYVANSANSNQWAINYNAFILSIIKFIRFNFEFSILFAFAVRINKKKKNLKNKLKTRNKLLSHEELLNLDLILKRKYNISVKELLKEAKEKEIKKEFEIKSEIKIPLNIFNKKLSPAEVLCKYLKENKKMRFSEIAKLINRDERSIWTNYNNAVKKMREKIKDEKKVDKTILVSINLFADRRLSVLESVIKYLKEKGFRNYEIASMINKDQRNIYTVYLRAEKKMK